MLENFQNDMISLYNLRNETGDFQIFAGQTLLTKAHRFVLSARSDYFRNLFESPF